MTYYDTGAGGLGGHPFLAPVRTFGQASGGGAASYSTLSDVNTLIAALGVTNATIPGFYDRRVNVTSSSNNVSAWADCRTTGAGPTLSYFGSGTNPTVSSGTSPVTLTGGCATLNQSAASAAWNNAGPFTMATIIQTAATSGNFLTLYSSTAHASLYLTTNTGPVWAGNYGSNIYASSLATSNNSTLRLVVLTIASGGATLGITVPNQSTATGSGSPASHTTQLTLGAYQPGSNIVSGCIVSAIFCGNFAASAGQIATLFTWANSYHSAVAA